MLPCRIDAAGQRAAHLRHHRHREQALARRLRLSYEHPGGQSDSFPVNAASRGGNSRRFHDFGPTPCFVDLPRKPQPHIRATLDLRGALSFGENGAKFPNDAFAAAAHNRLAFNPRTHRRRLSPSTTAAASLRSPHADLPPARRNQPCRAAAQSPPRHRSSIRAWNLCRDLALSVRGRIIQFEHGTSVARTREQRRSSP